MVYSNEYQQIRRIWKKDVRGVMALIRQSVHNDELVRRTRSEVLARLEDYWVLEIDRTLAGCVAIHPYPDHATAELACLYVNKGHEGQGYGRKLVAFAEGLARDRGARTVFALSTQAFAFFQQKGGYREAGPDVLPPPRRERYEASHRHSKILVKDLPPATGEVVRHG
jgi:amino-acid N-acetyltransferase